MDPTTLSPAPVSSPTCRAEAMSARPDQLRATTVGDTTRRGPAPLRLRDSMSISPSRQSSRPGPSASNGATATRLESSAGRRAQPRPHAPGSHDDSATGRHGERNSPESDSSERRSPEHGSPTPAAAAGPGRVGQRPREFLGGLETIRRLPGQGGLDRGPESGGNADSLGGQRRQLARHVPREDGVQAGPGVGRRAADHLIDHAAQRVDVAAGVEPGIAERLLRTHVERRAEPHSGGRQPSRPPERRAPGRCRNRPPAGDRR